METVNRFIVLDPEGRDEGVAEIAANFVVPEAAAAAVPGGQLRHDDDDDDDDAALPLLPLHHRLLESPIQRLLPSLLRVGFAALGTTAVAVVAARGAFPPHVPNHNVHSTVFASSLCPGCLPNLLDDDSIWTSIPRGGTFIAMPQIGVFVPVPMMLDDARTSSHFHPSSTADPLPDATQLDLGTPVHWSELSPRRGTGEATLGHYSDNLADQGFPMVARLVAALLVLMAFAVVYLLKSFV